MTTVAANLAMIAVVLMLVVLFSWWVAILAHDSAYGPHSDTEWVLAEEGWWCREHRQYLDNEIAGSILERPHHPSGAECDLVWARVMIPANGDAKGDAT